jgi:hypothetical protein
VGYFEFDPANPPQTAQEVLDTLTPDNVILHTGDFDNGWMKEDEYVRVPENSTIGFFIVPNGTLEEALVGEGNAPLFTIAHLNPGHFDQVVTFWDPYKEQIIFSYEETEIQGDRSDQDFADILFLIDGKDPLGIQLNCAE